MLQLRAIASNCKQLQAIAQASCAHAHAAAGSCAQDRLTCTELAVHVRAALDGRLRGLEASIFHGLRQLLVGARDPVGGRRVGWSQTCANETRPAVTSRNCREALARSRTAPSAPSPQIGARHGRSRRQRRADVQQAGLAWQGRRRPTTSRAPYERSRLQRESGQCRRGIRPALLLGFAHVRGEHEQQHHEQARSRAGGRPHGSRCPRCGSAAGPTRLKRLRPAVEALG